MNQRPEDLEQMMRLLNRKSVDLERQRRQSPFVTLFPETGLSRRELYPKQIEFFRAGLLYKERLFMAGNRIGKTVAGAYEATCHLTGCYPEWWAGRRFEYLTDGWASGTTSQTTRDVVQAVLLGKSTGLGLIPVELILDTVAGRSIAGSVETVRVRHRSGNISKLSFKSYEQGRRSFEGEAKDFIWCDEEPPMDVYGEMLVRLMTTKGIAFTTFTPLLGMSEVVSGFLEDDREELRASRFVYVWHASIYTREVLDGLERIGFLYPQQIIWNKGRTVLTRTHYWYQHEPCWYLRKKNAPWYGKAGQNSTIWDSASPKFIMGASDEEKFDHPTQKPVELMRKAILNHTKPGEFVYDAFLGSGTTLAAAEVTGRVCYGLELDPKYADVVIERWQGLTGKKATLEGDGRTFAAVQQDRVRRAA